MSALPSSPPVPATNDISHRAYQLARLVDRWSPGTYQVTIVKGDILSVDWDVSVVRVEQIQRVSLKNKRYAAE